MVTAQHILTVLSLLSLSLASQPPIPPAHIPARSLEDTFQVHRPRSGLDGYLPKPPSRRKQARGLKRGPSVGISDVTLDVHQRAESGQAGKGKGKRALDVNGTEVHLGTAQNTFVVPVSIGSPPSIYPLQLDLASSDLLVASTLCSSTSCPTSLGPSVNAYYDVSKGSAGFEAVNGNKTYWNSSYADGTTASGIVVREVLTMGEVVLEGQVMGLMNATNLTLSQQKISGILGLGFPRLSALSHILLDPTTAQDTSSSSSVAASSAVSSSSSLSSSATASSSASATSSSGTTPAYYPPVLENLVRQPHIPYPVFALALAPPPSNSSSTSTSTSSSATASSTSRYQSSYGSLTLGGVSNHYISVDTASGRTVNDIEWHEVIPFGKARSFTNDSAEALSRTNTVSASASATSTSTSSAPSSSSSSSGSASRKRSSSSELNAYPSNLEELGDEEYLFWTLELHNVSLNGTNIPLNSSYADLGLGSLALLDVGFNGISGPQQDVVKIFQGITDARQVSEGRWVVPCDTRMTIGFSFGGRYVQLQPSDWISTQIDSSSFCLAWPIAAPSTGDGMDWQLGTPFLKKVYSIFSYGINGIQAPLVGFLPLEDSPTGTSGSSSSSSSTASSSGSTNSQSSNMSSGTTSYNPNSPTPTTIEELHLTTTIKTILPNQILPDPSYTTPSYVYSTTLPPGVTQYLGLANSSIYTQIEEVPVVSLDSAATSRIASMAGGENGDGGSAAPGGSSGAERRVRLMGMGMGIGGLHLGLVVGVLGVVGVVGSIL
ncbi:uncharacterized protein I303_107389 [Kwoniella dejecticola CBS 10117]|uniref:Peptidase A1 domain-containing protein n=1 Tax=Kwoniella dejecticola CBS 10117 TaxID=1296121 RepID=A0A1A5ZZK6_9TREE|nr:uncharacterized protein I303_06793 [Kwoniella dejecticola CBS 10117]OBR83232.1 hypothetical protein I303_06793 [Kwoniella dejecticola CBS 10117]